MNALRPCKHWNREIWRSAPIGDLIVVVHHWDLMQYTNRDEPAHRTISLQYAADDYDMPNGVDVPLRFIPQAVWALIRAAIHARIPGGYRPTCEGCCGADMDLLADPDTYARLKTK